MPYFKAGLENNEFCMWITSEPLLRRRSQPPPWRAMSMTWINTCARARSRSWITASWYTLGGSFDSGRVLQGWVEKLDAARARGFDGLRLTGNTFWLEKSGLAGLHRV